MMNLPIQYQHKGAIGEEIRFSHDACGDARQRLYVKRTMKGYIHHCFNCGESGFSFASGASPKETLNAIEQLRKQCNVSGNKKELSLPKDFTHDIPDRGLAWLFKYGIKEEEIVHYRFGYSRRFTRLVLPVYNPKGHLIYWQGRNLGNITKDNPKYVNIRNGRVQNVVFQTSGIRSSNSYNRGNSKLIQHERQQNTNRITTPKLASKRLVIVEDILSAIKVARTEVKTVALLGSYIADSLLTALARYNDVSIWLDYDKQKESIAYCRKINALLHNVKARPIITLKDPKEYTTNQIKKVLQRR